MNKGRKMKQESRRAWLILLALGLLFGVAPVSAQDTLPIPFPQESGLSIQQMRVQVMPEFDDPRVLVIVQGRVGATASELPRPVTFHLPRGAQINQMAVMNVTTGETLAQPYDAFPDPDDPAGTLVTYTLDTAHFFFEYYYDPLVGETDKQFAYHFVSPRPVDDLLIEVQQPASATDFTMEPLATIARFDEIFGLTYHQYRVGALPAGQAITLTISYTKTDPNPSVSRQELASFFTSPNTPAEPAPIANSGSSTLAAPAQATLPAWTALLIGGVLLAGGGAFYYQRVRSPNPTAGQTPSLTPTHHTLCAHCAVALKENARFCQACGVQAKRVIAPFKKAHPFATKRPSFTPRWLAGVGLAVLLVSLLWWANTGGQGQGSAPLDRETMVAGAQVYVTYCGECHGAQAEGNNQAPALNTFGTTHRHSDEALRRIIRQGQGEMPAWAESLTPAEIESVIYFIKRQWTPEQRLQQADLS